MWRGEDSNLRRLSRQIYSLFPLAAREPLRNILIKAGERIRTADRLITNQLLYQLSYSGIIFKEQKTEKHGFERTSIYIRDIDKSSCIINLCCPKLSRNYVYLSL